MYTVIFTHSLLFYLKKNNNMFAGMYSKQDAVAKLCLFPSQLQDLRWWKCSSAHPQVSAVHQSGRATAEDLLLPSSKGLHFSGYWPHFGDPERPRCGPGRHEPACSHCQHEGETHAYVLLAEKLFKVTLMSSTSHLTQCCRYPALLKTTPQAKFSVRYHDFAVQSVLTNKFNACWTGRFTDLISPGEESDIGLIVMWAKALI